MKITIVAGARPNFIKVASIIHAIQRQQESGVKISFRLIHTGQHYDALMSGAFFDQLNIPIPDHNLEAGGGSQSEQTAAIMAKFETELLVNVPDYVIVVGDVTSTMACTLAAVKLNIKVAHVEAGIRSYDRTMPEEVNRIVVDSVCDLYYTTTEDASLQLIKEGVDKGRIVFVGNTMIDTLVANITKLRRPDFWEAFLLSHKGYLLLTLHRPANVDDSLMLEKKLSIISEEAGSLPVVFPVHPRTRKNLDATSISLPKNIILVDPLPYLEFMYLLKESKGVITDSGGITEEATYLNIPCMTLRTTTERPETCTIGSNVLLGDDDEMLTTHIQHLLIGQWKSSGIPQFWDGLAADRIVRDLLGRSGF
jgi:UDP-N-acetylglucosamine 2-epimerase (non-hydrolysing)